MTVTFGTVASAYAYSSFAPRRMMPAHSWVTPGRKPGTSTNVRIGIEKASHVLTNLAAFSEASISRQPARCSGWFATTPTGAPATRPEPTTMFFANPSCYSDNVWSSITVLLGRWGTYGWFG